MMVLLRNVSGGLVMVGERYLFPGESRRVDEATAAEAERGSGEALERKSGEASEDKALLSSEGEPSPPAPLPESGEGRPHPSPPQSGEGAVVSGDDLTVIRGIGPRTAEALVLMGVDSYAVLAAADAVELAAALDGASRAQVERWIVQAQDLAAEES